jgi:hypothetical protein
MTRAMDRKPNAPPFPVGTRLRYTGDMRIDSGGEDRKPLLRPGMLGTVVETRPGRQGTLRWIDLDDGEEPFQDTSTDGWSVVEAESGKRLIARPENWELANDG